MALVGMYFRDVMTIYRGMFIPHPICLQSYYTTPIPISLLFRLTVVFEFSLTSHSNMIPRTYIRNTVMPQKDARPLSVRNFNLPPASNYICDVTYHGVYRFG
jgi:hypothetical protein